MKNYLKQLEQSGISEQNINQLSLQLAQRASKVGKPHPSSVYHALATDMALGALETSIETAKELGTSHTAIEWLGVITGCDFGVEA